MSKILSIISVAVIGVASLIAWVTFSGIGSVSYGAAGVQVSVPSAGGDGFLPISTTTGQYKTISSTSSPQFWVNVNRTDTYTADGGILRPYKSLTAAGTAITALGVTSAALNLAPGTYSEQTLSLPDIPLVINGNGASIIMLSGASLGAGNLTISNDIDLHDLTIFGNTFLTSTSLTNPHTAHSTTFIGNLNLKGLVGIDSNSAIFDQNTALYPFLSQNASSTLTIGSGSLAIITEADVEAVINNHGTFNLDVANVQTSTSTRYAIMSTTTGSVLRINGMSLQNFGTGGGINCANGATSASPNQISNIQVTLGAGSTGAIDCGSATSFVSHYTAFTQAGVRLFSTGTDNQYPSFEGMLVNVGGRVGIASTTPGVPLAVTGAIVGTDWLTIPQLNATNTLATSTFNGGVTVAGGVSLTNFAGTGTLCVHSVNGSLQVSNSDCGSSSGLTSYDAWSHVTYGGATFSATSSPLRLTGSPISLSASSTSEFDNITFTNATGTYATTTAESSGILNITGTATSSFTGGVKLANLSQTGTATSTFANGLQIEAGTLFIKNWAAAGTVCVKSIAGILSLANADCGSGSGGGSIVDKFSTTTAGTGIFANSAVYTGFGTSSPGSMLSIHATSTNGTGSPLSLFAIASSSQGNATTTLFSVNNIGTHYVNLDSSTSTFINMFNQTFSQVSTSSYNTSYGLGALAYATNTSAQLVALSGGYGNTAFGWNALNLATTSPGNTAFGAGALWGSGLVSGIWSATGQNTAVGYFALASSTSGNKNTAIGYNSGRRLTTNSSNVFIGDGILNGSAAFTGAQNVFIGSGAVGTGSGNLNSNTVIGYLGATGMVTAVSSNNVFIGASTAVGAGAKNKNSCLGDSCLQSLTTGINNSVFGYQSGFNITTGFDNIIIGETQNTGGNNLTTGNGNILMGYNPMGTSTGATRYLNFGNLLFAQLPATSTATSIVEPISGTFGIATSTPAAVLSVQANAGRLDGGTVPLFLIGSSTASATSSLLLVNNMGSVQINNPVNIVNALNIKGSTGVSLFNIDETNTTGAMWGIGSSTPGADLTVQLNAVDTNYWGFIISSSTATASTTLFAIDNVGHIIASSTNPVVTSCGTAPVLTGDDVHGEVVPGATATGCTISFSKPWNAAPICTISNQSMSVVNAMTYSISSSALTITMTGIAGNKVDYICMGLK